MPEPTFAYLDPSRGPAAPADPYTPRMSQIKGLTIGLMSNMFTDASAFLEDLKAPLGEALEGVTFKFYDKGELRNATFPAAPEMIERIVSECDGAVLAYGHCGSCTAGTVRDGVALARAGLPVAVLVTAKFRDEAAFIARAGGLPGTPFVFLPHPIAGREAAYHRAVAAAITGEIIEALRSGQTSDCSQAA